MSEPGAHALAAHVLAGELNDYGITDYAFAVEEPGNWQNKVYLAELLDPYVGKQVRITLVIEELKLQK